MDKKYIENQYHLAVLDFQTARSEEAQWEARKTMARLEQIAAQEYGFESVSYTHLDVYKRQVLNTQMICTKEN